MNSMDKVGRPTSYTQDIADRVCEQLALGKSLRTVCKPDDMPCVKTIFNWFRTQDGFLQQYERAKEEAAEMMSEDMIEIADGDGDVQRDRLRVDTRKWLASKLKPKRYGDKIDMTTNGKELPTPILGYVQPNDSNNESDEDGRKD